MNVIRIIASILKINSLSIREVNDLAPDGANM